MFHGSCLLVHEARAQVDKLRLGGSGIAQAEMRASMGLSDEEGETPRKKRFRETQSENVEVRSCTIAPRRETSPEVWPI